jgi:hypothetical protein
MIPGPEQYQPQPNTFPLITKISINISRFDDQGLIFEKGKDQAYWGERAENMIYSVPI